MWFSACNELLMAFFGLAAMLCWMSRDRGWPVQIAGVIFFALALLSKESAVIFVPLFFVTAPITDWRRSIVSLTPYLAFSALTIATIFAAEGESFRFHDGSFSLQSPFAFTWARSFARVLWIWGWIAGLLLYRDPRVFSALTWIGIALLPYVFLTYSTQISSHQTYLARIGLALLTGLAFAATQNTRILATAVLVVVSHNFGIIWFKKRAQFLKRAEPTEQLIAMAKRTEGLIWVRCFPRARVVADQAVTLGAGRSVSILIWSEEEARRRGAAAVFCYSER